MGAPQDLHTLAKVEFRRFHSSVSNPAFFFSLSLCRFCSIILCHYEMSSLGTSFVQIKFDDLQFLKTAVEGVLGVSIEPNGYHRTRRWPKKLPR